MVNPPYESGDKIPYVLSMQKQTVFKSCHQALICFQLAEGLYNHAHPKKCNRLFRNRFARSYLRHDKPE